jgi:ribosomal protein S21
MEEKVVYEGPLRKKINETMDKIVKKNKRYLDMAKIQPFDRELLLAQNGLILFVAPQGAGKSYNISQFILMTENLHDKPVFNSIVNCATNDDLDKTLKIFKKEFKTKVEYIEEIKLIQYLNAYIKRQKKFYAMVDFVESKYKNIDKTLQKSFDKYHSDTLRKRVMYINRKITRYKNPPYPNHMLLILDDVLGSDLLESKKCPLVKLLTKLRHYNITTIIAQQSTKGIGKEVRRQSSDCIIWKGIGYDDFIDFMREMSIPFDINYMWEVYHSLQQKHDYLAIHKHISDFEVYRQD